MRSLIRVCASRKRVSRRAAALVGVVAAVTVTSSSLIAHASHHEEFGDHVRPGWTELLSVATSGSQANGRSGATCFVDGPSISDDGTRIAFTSHATNLDPSDTNGSIPDVYVRDRRAGRTTLASTDGRGLSGPVPPDVSGTLCVPHPTGGFVGSWEPAISGNGRFVAFTSTLILKEVGAAGVAPFSLIYVHDLKDGATELVSVSRNKEDGNLLGFPNGSSTQPAISENGRYVTFLSSASDLVAEDACSGSELLPAAGCAQQLYVFDRNKEQTKLISLTSEGAPAETGVIGGSGSRHSLSDNGRYAVFVSRSNLTPNDTNFCPTSVLIPPGCNDVFIHDIQGGTTELISVGRNGTSTEWFSSLMVPGQSQAVSADGRYVVFESSSRELVPAAPALAAQSIYVRDRKLDRTERISASTGEYLGGTRSSISDDGRFVMQHANGGNAIVGEASAEWCCDTAGILRHDRATGQSDIVRLDRHQGEVQGEAPAWEPVISGSARHFVWSGRRAHGFEDRNDEYDVFLRDLGEVPSLGAAFLGGKKGTDQRSGAVSSRDGLNKASDEVGDAITTLAGGDLVAARVAHRTKYDDLYVRIDLDRLAGVGLGGGLLLPDTPVIYGLRFRAGSERYEIRVGGGVVPDIGLFRCGPADCSQVARLRGSYGIVGESVVAVLPLSLLPDPSGSQFRAVRAFAALGSYRTGANVLIDDLQLVP